MQNNSQFSIFNSKIAVIGLGYVGLPLAHAFSEKYEVVGFDIDKSRIEELERAFDRTLELDENQMREAIKNGMKFTMNIEDIKDSNIYIVTVPTPIKDNNDPDLTPLIKSSQTVARVLKQNDIVIYESTVYPGGYWPGVKVRGGGRVPVASKGHAA